MTDKEKTEFEVMRKNLLNLFLRFYNTAGEKECNCLLKSPSSNFKALESFLQKFFKVPSNRSLQQNLEQAVLQTGFRRKQCQL